MQSIPHNSSSSAHILEQPTEANYLHLTSEENGDLRDPVKANILLVLELSLPTSYLSFFPLKHEGRFLFSSPFVLEIRYEKENLTELKI